MTKNIKAEFLNGARASVVRADPNLVVLEMQGAKQTRHYLLTRDDLLYLCGTFMRDTNLVSIDSPPAVLS